MQPPTYAPRSRLNKCDICVTSPKNETVAKLVQVQRGDCDDFLGKTWQTACPCRAPRMARLADQQHAANSREYWAFWPLPAPGAALTLLKCRFFTRFLSIHACIYQLACH